MTVIKIRALIKYLEQKKLEKDLEIEPDLLKEIIQIEVERNKLHDQVILLERKIKIEEDENYTIKSENIIKEKKMRLLITELTKKVSELEKEKHSKYEEFMHEYGKSMDGFYRRQGIKIDDYKEPLKIHVLEKENQKMQDELLKLSTLLMNLDLKLFPNLESKKI